MLQVFSDSHGLHERPDLRHPLTLTHQERTPAVAVAAPNDTHNECLQLDMFTDYEALENDEKVQRVILSIRRKYGSNAILKGMNYLEGATARERNTQIGGHRA